MSDDEEGGNAGAAEAAKERDPRGRAKGKQVDRTRTAADNNIVATSAAWNASAGMSKSVLQHMVRHNRGEDSEMKDGFATDWLLLTSVKNGSGSSKATWGEDEALEDARDVMVTMSQGGSLSLFEMSKILSQANLEHSNAGARSRSSKYAITLVSSSEEHGVAFEDVRRIKVRSSDARREIQSQALSSPPKRSRNDESSGPSQESPATLRRMARGRGGRGRGSGARGGGRVGGVAGRGGSAVRGGSVRGGRVASGGGAG
jgi:hypothetical protein